MDTGKGTFQQVTSGQEELAKVMDELERKYPEHGGWFREGETIEIRGSIFRVQSVKPTGLRLKLVKRVKGGEEWIPHAQANQISELDDDDICPECGGSGEVAGDYFSDDGMSPCARCNGKGGEE